MKMTEWGVSALVVVFEANRAELSSYTSRAMFREYVELLYMKVKEWYHVQEQDGLSIRDRSGTRVKVEDVVARIKVIILAIYLVRRPSSLKITNELRVKWNIPRAALELMLMDCINWQNREYRIEGGMIFNE